MALAAGELGARAFFKDANVLFPRYHTDYAYGKYRLRGIRPNAQFWHTSVDGRWRFVTNSKGFRNAREFAYEKPEGTLRLLSLGDSHTQGYEVRQDFTYSAAAERYLRDRGLKAEAINAGVSGYSTAEALAFLENEGYRYQPDAVVLGFYANDFEDNVKAGLFELDAQGRLVERKFAHLPGVRIQNALYSLAPVRWLSENSYFYSLLFNAAWEAGKAALARAAASRAQARGAAPGEGNAVPAALQTEYAVPTHRAVSRANVELALALLERMQRFCLARGIRLIVADVPAFSAPQRFVSSFPPAMEKRLREAGIEFLASSELLAGYQGVAELHRPHGHQHISEFTHILIGAEIGRRVLQQAGAPPAKSAPQGPARL